jgi:uncharacterized repeat protein (TIGR01451 family)
MNKNWSITILLVGLSLALWATTSTRALEVTVDEFSTDQATLTLTYPGDLGGTAESVISGAGILGGERDIQIELIGGTINGNTVSAGAASDTFSYAQGPTINASGLIQWDGTDGDATTLDPTGLGGLDLTSGGIQDAFVISIVFDDNPIDIILEVYTDAGNASQYTLNLPGGIWLPEEYVVPFGDFVTLSGAGADFGDVGAITLYMTSVTAPDLVLDFVRTTSIIHASKDDVLAVDNNSNGQANPGDTLEYTVVISNLVDTVGAAAGNVTFSDTPDPNTTLVVGSVSSVPLGTVTTGNTPGDTTVAVDIGDIADGATVTITFRVTVNDPLPGCVAQVSNQGLVNSDTLTDMPTDDPDTPAVDDATDTPTYCLYDFGDAPDPTYPTLLANNGARHVLDGYTYLGAGVDDEADGQPNATATGDDANGVPDDEDGVVFTSALSPGATADIDVTANQTCTLSAWIDFNIDGDWGDTGEDLFPGGQTLYPTGTHSLSFGVPAGATLGTTYARFRCFAGGALSPTGEASNGEVEDYEVEIVAALSLGDFVWYDTDQDGIQDGSEPGVQNIVVDLYDTADCSGISIDTDTTDASGGYGFTGLPPDTYCLQFSSLPAGWSISPQDQGADDSVDSDADPATGQITNINLAADDPDEDVGVYAEGSIGDTVWCDVDGDDTYDAGEGVAGVTVDLYEDTDCDTAPDGAAIDTQDTVGDGQYLFTPLPVGPPGGPAVCYVVQVDVGDMGACNNPITPVEYDVPLDADDPDDLDDDFGFNQLISLGDFVWYDTDQDGIQDGGEPGVENITVDLYDNGTCTAPSVDSDTTDASGLYGFTDLTPGTYCLQFSNIPAGWTITLQNQGADDSVDSDADPATAQITNINLTVTDLDEDMGLYTEGSIGDTVWCDTDLDGLYDAGEGVAGVTVDLYQDTDCDTNPDGAVFLTQDTTGDGQYLFTGLPVGPPGGPAVCYVVQVDVGDMGACNNPITPIEYDVPLDADNPDDLDDDFGFNQQQLASIGDTVWWDVDQDGLQDGGESGLASVTVNLYDGSGALQASTSTDGSGIYGFSDLSPGDYYVEFVLPSGYDFSPQDQGADDTLDSDADPTTGQTVATTLDPGEDDPTWDAGMYRTGPALQIDKTINLAAIAPNGPSLVYTLTVVNVGDVTLNPVRVVDTLDVGLTFVPGSATPAETSVVGQVVTWADVTAGAGLAPGGSTQITFQAIATTTIGTYVNHALAEGTPPVGGVVTDTDQVPLTVADPSVALDKEILAPGAVGGYITFTIHLSNTGPSVIEVLPLYDSFTGDIRYYTGNPVADAIDNVNGTLTWNDLTTHFGDMAPGQSFVVETVFQIVSSGDTFSATNVARVSNGIDEYGNPANDDQDSVVIADMPTAIELLYFRASQRGQAVRLSWETASEVDSYGFRLLRSHTGALAQAIEMAFVPAQGNAGGARYSLVDRDVVAGQTYTYWLVDVDVHGVETVHTPRAVTLTAPAGRGSLTLFLPFIVKP